MASPPPYPPQGGPVRSRGRPVELLVAEVPSGTTEADLLLLFAKVSAPGEVRGVTFQGPGALVRMHSEAGAQRAAAELDGRLFRGIRLSVRRFRTFKIFVALLSEHCTAQDLQELFEEFGPVVECSIVRDYAFVHMVYEEDARAAIQHLDGREVKGRRIVVEASRVHKSSHHDKEAAETTWNHDSAPSYRNQPSASLGVDNRAQPSTGRSAAYKDQTYVSHSDTSYKSKFSAPRAPSASARTPYGGKTVSSHDIAYKAHPARSSRMESYEDELAYSDESFVDEGSYSLSEQSGSYGPSYETEATGGRAASYKKLSNNGAPYKFSDSLSTRSRASAVENCGVQQPTTVPFASGYRAQPVHSGLILPASQDVPSLGILQSETAAHNVPYERVRLSPPREVHDDYYREFSVGDKQYASKPGAAAPLHLRYEHVRLSPPRISREDLSYRGGSASKPRYASEAEAVSPRQPYKRIRLSPPHSSHGTRRRRDD